MNPYGRPRTHRLDANQAEIVKYLKAKGYSVFHLFTHADIVVGYRGLNFIFELKSSSGRTTLTVAEENFARGWRGQLSIVTSSEQVEKIISEKLGIYERGRARILRELK